MKLVSQIDNSVNFITESEIGFFEARYVCRPYSPYFIVYLSSQSGCSKACRMCHLTATRQVKSVDATLSDFTTQAQTVLQHWKGLGADHKLVHFNFMARGEPLACKTLIHQADKVLGSLQSMALETGLDSRFLVSTILPKTLGTTPLSDVFQSIKPEIYYSFYSDNPSFRRRWLPQAMYPHEALSKLWYWQRETGKRPKVHFAYIKGQNDSEVDVRSMCYIFTEYGLEVDINIVRYNPPDNSSQESDESTIASNVALMRTLLPRSTVRVIPRVGLDVFASCGMFANING
jgi:23S rRNA (adenine2503-C2)-methyltransferase